MSILKPTFPDGVVVKAEDLRRILDYTRIVEQGILRYFGPGIIYGTVISYTYSAGVAPNPDTITVTVSGPALISTENKEFISLDADETITGTFLYPVGTEGVDIYIYESDIVAEATRQNLANTPRPVSTRSVYSLSNTPPTPFTTGKYAKIAKIVNPNTPITYKSMVTLQHTDTFLDGVYTGPILNASASLANLSVTTAKLANLSVTTQKIANASITSSKIANGAIREHHLTSTGPIIGSSNIKDNSITTPKIVDGSITPDKISFISNISMVAELPTLYVIPALRPTDPPNPNRDFSTRAAYVWDFGEVSSFDPWTYRFLPLNRWIPRTQLVTPSYIPSWINNMAIYQTDVGTNTKTAVFRPHNLWVEKIARRPPSELAQRVSLGNVNVYTQNKTVSLTWCGDVQGNILWNTSDITFPALYVIWLTEVQINKFYAPHALKISSAVPRSLGFPQYLTLRGPVLTRYPSDNFAENGTYHTPFIIPPDGYRIIYVSSYSYSNGDYTSDNYTYKLTGATARQFSVWSAPLPAFRESGEALSSDSPVRGMCVKCFVEIFRNTGYHPIFDEAFMLPIEIVLKKLPSSGDFILLKEPISQAYVWKSSL